MKWFGGGEKPRPRETAPAGAASRVSRRSTGLAEFTRILADKEGASVLDLGPTSPANISFLTGFGGRVCTEDIVHASREPRYIVKQPDGSLLLDPHKFFAENLSQPEGQFDAVLCWDVADYLTEPLVKPLVERLSFLLKPKGVLLAFFHAKEAGPGVPPSRYHIVSGELLDLEPRHDLRLQRVFNNRHVENLFKGFSSLKFFLARDNVREVLAVR
jgi:SAM-dependent methyltransferase